MPNESEVKTNGQTLFHAGCYHLQYKHPFYLLNTYHRKINKKLVIPEQLRPTNCTRPSGVWTLVLQVITPCAEEDLAIQY